MDRHDDKTHTPSSNFAGDLFFTVLSGAEPLSLEKLRSERLADSATGFVLSPAAAQQLRLIRESMGTPSAH